MNTEQALVSVVIPTRNRPDMVTRAVRSVLAQTYANVEVIVVVDGPDEQTIHALAAMQDPRIRVVSLGESVGGAEARNLGVRNAHGPWVALLDDDDEWLPGKLSSQVNLLDSLPPGQVFIGSRYIERSASGDRVLPKIASTDGRPISEVLFCRQSATSGTGYVQTSTWLISRHLLLRVPFTKGLKRNQDADWMIRALTQPDVVIGIVSEPLVIFHDLEGPDRVSRKADWRFHYEWAVANRHFFTRKAMAFFLLTSPVQDAVAKREPLSVILFLFRQSFRLGSPTPLALAFFLYYWLTPNRAFRRVRARLAEARV